jgi:ABC-type nitrate/sulfonate/bicarbonate transport system ATPase subunit
MDTPEQERQVIKQYAIEERLMTIDKLGLKYGDRTILRDITVEIDNIIRPDMKQGQVVALLGPSGMGKTQLFRCIAGLQPYTSGNIVALRNGSLQEPLAGEIGVVQQAYPLLNHRTVLSNLQLAARCIKGDPIPEIHRLLNHFGLFEKLHAYPQELSGGQRQRIAIIQQLLCSSHFLLMDEPFSGLDVLAKARVMDTVRTVTTEHELNTVIFTTHDLESAVALADDIWVLGREAGKEGATVVKRIDLCERGIAWDPDYLRNPMFWPTVLELKELFNTL